MGAWGPGIFDDDEAADLRGEYRNFLADAQADTGGTDAAARNYEASLEHLGDTTAFWLALALIQWKLGRLDPRVKAAALRIIDDGIDLAKWDTSPLRRKRASALSKARATIVAPQPAAKPKTHDTVARLDPRKEADRLRALHPAPDLLRIEPGDRQQSGDPYLNQARDLIEAHRTYPNVLGKYGVPVEGTPVYEFLLDRRGHLLGLKLVTSSGMPALDEAGAAMIRATAPFPPLPADAPGEVLHVMVTLPIYPK